MKFASYWSLALAGVVLTASLAMVLGVQGDDDSADASVRNTQAETIPPLNPAEALASIKAPPCFEVTLFAHEPEVRQPIALAFDARGRVWIAENYTYAETPVNHDLTQNDRIVVLEDRDGDGRSDERKVFWADGKRLTSVEVGFGGIWALAPPHLLFIPDRDGNDIPDGPPEVVLDGWEENNSRHNFVNGLRWGPDGWLYGRHGILSTSLVGPPGSAENERTPLNCAIWRYHPITKKFEVVCSGTTNSWGHDWDEHGQLFFINTVIGHLWHAVPGAHFRRMYGEDLNPHVYELIEQTADHVHWDSANEDWTALRTKAVSPGTDAAGGGHAHSGLMIYQGETWPKQYRGGMFTLNYHGRRINHDALERHGATYIGKHRPDVLTVGDPYFRGIDLAFGQDGGVWVLDWSDIGECHDNDGVHRTSGRIYKVQWVGEKGEARPKHQSMDVASLTSDELATRLVKGDEWFARQARKQLQERHAAEHPLGEARKLLLTAFEQPAATSKARLRALWALNAIGGVDEAWLVRQTGHDDEHVRLWAVRLLLDHAQASEAAREALAKRASVEKSGLVLTYLASAMQRLPFEDRFAIARSIATHEEFAEDRVLPLMVWYGLEEAVPTDGKRAVEVIAVSKMPQLTRCIARRVTGEIETSPDAVEKLVELVSTTDNSEKRLSMLQGMSAALDGWLKAPQPRGWEQVVSKIDAEGLDGASRQLVRELSVVFGSGRAVDELKQIAVDRNLAPAVRKRALRSLAEAKAAGVNALLTGQLGDRDVAEEAIRGLAIVGEADLVDNLLKHYPRFLQPGKLVAVEVLASRPAASGALLDAVERGIIARDEVQPFQLRQMQLSGGAEVQQKIATLWPELRLIDGDRLAQIAELRKRLEASSLSTANAVNGKKLFEQSCAKCHKLFGRGEGVGPELTGAQRSNLNYWLENIVDPSASVATNFRMSLILLDDGRVLNGVVLQQTERTLAVQTPTERLVIDRKTVEVVKPSELSLMPNGLLDQLSEAQIRDLFAYLMAPTDPLAETGKSTGR